VSKGNKKRRAVRMLEHAVRLSIPTADPSMSEMANGRQALNLRKDVHLLKQLMRDDPEHLFWKTLHGAIFKLVKFVRQTRC